MLLAPGTRLGSYEIVGPLGAGGMGQVYRARDSRLGRDVAIKALPPEFSKEPERLARFEREARLLASLSHANIAGIHGLEEVDGARYLVLEFVEGETLEARLGRGPLPLDEALEVGKQVAAAVEAAHESGVVHRDLKPGNVMLTASGAVKVLDFGLAKSGVADRAGSNPNLTESPTTLVAATQAGVILGTAAYMSPEQARGRPVDKRTDIWSFGCLLFECLSGRRLFQGETASDLIARILQTEPDWSLLPADLPPRLRTLLARCLDKDPRQRMRDIGEARIALENLSKNPLEESPRELEVSARARPRIPALVPWVVAALAIAAAAVTGLRREPPARPHTELDIVPPAGQRVAEDISYHPMAIAPDGRAVAYTIRVSGMLKLRLRRLDARQDVEIAGADGARNLFFSPDGEWIGFFDSRRMSKVSVRGGTPVELAEALQDRLGTWLDDGTIVYSYDTTTPLYRIPESGGTPVAVTSLDSTKRERTHRFPCALAGGPWVVFTAQTVDSPGGYDDASIDAVDVRTGERRHLYKGARRAAWAPGGFLLLARGSDLYAVAIDPENPRMEQDPVPVLAGVSGDASSGSSYFGIANDGTLAWIPGGEPEKTREVGWIDRAGRWTPTAIPPGPYLQLRLAPDGARALITAGPGGGASDLWLAHLRTGGINRLTHGNQGGSATWLPDGARFAYSRSDPAGGEVVAVRRLDGAGGEREIHRADHPIYVTDVSPDGRTLVFSDYGLRTGRIHLAAVDGRSGAQTLPAEGAGYEQAGMVSPDGRWIAYVTNKTRREEVCIRRLGGSGGSWQVSTRGAGGIRWGREGRELFYVSGEILMRVPVETRGDELALGQPEQLFEVPPSPMEISFRDYDYDAVSDRFLFTRPPLGVTERREIALSLGWATRLPEKLRASRSPRHP
jgi:serine/threonine-protein kinase